MGKEEGRKREVGKGVEEMGRGRGGREGEEVVVVERESRGRRQVWGREEEENNGR